MLEGVQDLADQRHTITFLATFKRLAVKSSDFEHCLLLMAEVHLAYSIGWADCLIAATYMRLGLPLVTLNDKHFRAIRGLRVVRPY